MARPASGPLAHAARVEAAHARATGQLREWVCWEPSCPQYGATHVTSGDAGRELARHYLDRHYRPPATPARSRLPT